MDMDMDTTVMDMDITAMDITAMDITITLPAVLSVKRTKRILSTIDAERCPICFPPTVRNMRTTQSSS